jgi:hypothetical protein
MTSPAISHLRRQPLASPEFQLSTVMSAYYPGCA